MILKKVFFLGRDSDLCAAKRGTFGIDKEIARTET